METRTIDKLFLELSQVTAATTAKELDLTRQLAEVTAERDALLAMIDTVIAIPKMSDAQLAELKANAQSVIDAAREKP